MRIRKVIYKGWFWTTSITSKVYGYLKWNNGVAYLEVLSNPKPEIKNDYKEDTFTGILNAQDLVIFYDCQFSRLSFPYNDYVVNFKYFLHSHGTKWTNEPRRLERFKLNYPLLFSWSQLRGIESDYEDNLIKIKRTNPVFNYDMFSNEDFSISIGYETEFPLTSTDGNYAAKQETYIVIFSKSDIDFKLLFERITEITNIFRLLTSRRFQCDSVIKCSDVGHQDYFIVNNEFVEDNHLFEMNLDDYLFTFSEVNENKLFNTIINNYLTIDLKLKDSIKIISDCIENTRMSNQFKFLNLVYILDMISGVNQAQIRLNPLTKADLKHFDILSSKNVPNNTIAYIRTKFEKLNYSKLKDKITLFLTSFNFIVENISHENISSFVDTAINTRNDLSHGTKKMPLFDNNQFQSVNEILINWISLIILHMLKVPETSLINKVKVYDPKHWPSTSRTN